MARWEANSFINFDFIYFITCWFTSNFLQIVCAVRILSYACLYFCAFLLHAYMCLLWQPFVLNRTKIAEQIQPEMFFERKLNIAKHLFR